MHELSIAQSLLQIALRECLASGHQRIDSVRIRIGKASGIMSDALLFAFDAIKEGTGASAARLEIEEVPVGGTCGSCGGSFTVEEEFVLCCPLCSAAEFRISAGRELDIVDMEVS